VTEWLLVAIVGLGTVALKGVGPLVLGGRRVPDRLTGVVSLLAPTLLAALIVTNTFATGTALNLEAGRFFTGSEVQARSNVVVLGQTPYMALFAASGSVSRGPNSGSTIAWLSDFWLKPMCR